MRKELNEISKAFEQEYLPYLLLFTTVALLGTDIAAHEYQLRHTLGNIGDHIGNARAALAWIIGIRLIAEVKSPNSTTAKNIGTIGFGIGLALNYFAETPFSNHFPNIFQELRIMGENLTSFNNPEYVGDVSCGVISLITGLLTTESVIEKYNRSKLHIQ